MGFVPDVLREFYQKLRGGGRVVIFVALDADALAACCILQILFRSDNIFFSTIPVRHLLDLEVQYRENREHCARYIFINCGGTVDITSFLEVSEEDEERVFYIIDSHRPLSHFNVYDRKQVKLLANRSELVDLPKFDDVLRPGMDEDDEEEEEDDEELSHIERVERAANKRLVKRKYRERRDELLFNYYKFTSTGTSAAHTAWNIALKMSKDTNNLLWLAIIGITDQLISCKIDRGMYNDLVYQLQPHVARLNSHMHDTQLHSRSALRIFFDTDINLDLLRHWSIFDCFIYSSLSMCKFQTWTNKGMNRLKEFMADVGIPSSEFKQKFTNVDPKIKSNLKEMFREKLTKYGFEEIDFLLPTFRLKSGYRNQFCASDFVWAINSLLEHTSFAYCSDKFIEGMRIIEIMTSPNPTEFDDVIRGIELSKAQHLQLIEHVQTLLELGRIKKIKSILYAEITTPTLLQPSYLIQLSRCSLNAAFVSKRNKDLARLPLFLACKVQNSDVTIAIGIPPLNRDSSKNIFFTAFERAAQQSGANAQQATFDANILLIRSSDLDRFRDSLAMVLE